MITDLITVKFGKGNINFEHNVSSNIGERADLYKISLEVNSFRKNDIQKKAECHIFNELNNLICEKGEFIGRYFLDYQVTETGWKYSLSPSMINWLGRDNKNWGIIAIQ